MVRPERVASLVVMATTVVATMASAEPLPPSKGPPPKEPSAVVPSEAPSPPKGEAASGSQIEHGSGRGRGDSRGPGAGDGRGRFGSGVRHGRGDGTGTAHGPGRGDGRGVSRDRSPAELSADGAPVAARSPLAIDVNDDFVLVPSVSYRLRYYHREGQDFVKGGVENSVRHRARVGLLAEYRSLANVFIQLQDARTFGEAGDSSSDFTVDSFDLHQGYATLMPLPHLSLRLGRQEIALANERLVGVPQFLEQARSFDGLHLRYDDAVELEAGYFLVRDRVVGPTGAFLPSGKKHLGLAHLGYEVAEPFHPHVLAVLDADTAIDRVVVTGGGLITGRVGSKVTLSYSGEGYYQGGAEGDLNVSAWLAAASTRVTLSESSVEPFAEVHAVLVSGDDEPADLTSRTFQSPYPRWHRIHGEMDFFVNFPRDTDGRGLRDLGGTLGFAPADVELTGAFHFFDAMASRPDGLRHFGFETNFKVSYPFWDYARIDTLYGLFVPGEIPRVALRDPRVEHFVYATAEVGF